jgi:nitrogen regulatory protein PII
MDLQKIEIIIADSFFDELIELLEGSGATGYTAIEIIRGKGKNKGEQFSEGLLPTTRSYLVFTVANSIVAHNIGQHVKPFLDDRGGILITYPVTYATGFK